MDQKETPGASRLAAYDLSLELLIPGIVVQFCLDHICIHWIYANKQEATQCLSLTFLHHRTDLILLSSAANLKMGE